MEVQQAAEKVALAKSLAELELIWLISASLDSLDWNESDLARASGVSQPTINQFLKGKRGLSEEARSKVLLALDMPLLAQKRGLDAMCRQVTGLFDEVRARTRWAMENIQSGREVN